MTNSPIQPTAKYTSIEDFIRSFDDDESAELSHLNLPTDWTISRTRIEYQLYLAENKWLSLFGIRPNQYDPDLAPAECSGNLKICTIAFARKRMDYLNPREHVTNDAQECLDIAQSWKDARLRQAAIDKGSGNTTDPLDPNSGGIMTIFSN